MTGIILSGAGGQLGKAFKQVLSFEEGFSLFAFERHHLDISDEEKVIGAIQSIPNIRYWINCAAYTKVDEAEKHEVEAYRFNAHAAGYIAKACKAKGVHLLHFSSDYVYDNGLQRPLLESDPTEPKSIYAKSKLAGEHLIQNSGCRHTIIRTSWVYGPGGHNFVNTMLRLGKMKSRLTIVGDQVGAPTLTTDIALACKDLIQYQQNDHPAAVEGIFNYANAGEVTWDNFARAIFNHAQIPCEVVTITTKEYGAPAPRPAYSVLNCDKIKSFLSAPIPTWEDALSRYLDKTNSETYEL